MSDAPGPDAVNHDEPFDRWVEVIAAIVLALATIASAWSGYQATRWSGVQSASFAEAGALRAESIRSSDVADGELTIDVEFFSIWLDAATTGNEELEELIEDSFRPEFTVAFDAWQATDPFGDPDTAATPFDLDEYVLEAADESDELRDQAEVETRVALDADENGDRYVLTTVVFASVLFFAGISTKFRSRKIKLALATFGFGAFAVGTAILVALPVH